MSEKKKPVKLEWQGGIASSAPDSGAEAVRMKGVQAPPPAAPGAARAWSGRCKARREVKGRGGKPVVVLHAFEPNATAFQREQLCRALKEKLACGGTSESDKEGGGIVLQVDEFARIEKVCAALGAKVVRAGGFG